MYTRIVQIHINIPATTQKHYSYIHIHILITITRFKKKMLLISLYVSKVMVLLIRSFTIAFLGIAHLTFWFRLSGTTVFPWVLPLFQNVQDFWLRFSFVLWRSLLSAVRMAFDAENALSDIGNDMNKLVGPRQCTRDSVNGSHSLYTGIPNFITCWFDKYV